MSSGDGELSTGTIASFCIAFVAAVLGLIWLFQGNDFFLYKTFAPKYEQVRRETFEQTKSYNQGMVQDLRRMQEEYIKADEAHKVALASVIKHVAADYPEESMPPDVREFVRQLRSNLTMPR